MTAEKNTKTTIIDAEMEKITGGVLVSIPKIPAQPMDEPVLTFKPSIFRTGR